MKQALWDRARLRLDRFSAEYLERFALIDPARYKDRPASAETAVCVSADDFMIVVAGGPGKHSAIVPTFGATRSVTRRVDDQGGWLPLSGAGGSVVTTRAVRR